MTTLRVTVDNRKNAQLLSKLLKSIEFVKKVEEDLPNDAEGDQFAALKNILESIEPGTLFQNIKDPVTWQKKVRDEWETR